MKKFVCENLEELKENYLDEPEERISPEERDIFYQAGKEGFEPQREPQRELEEEFIDICLGLIDETDEIGLNREEMERGFKKALDIFYKEG